MKAVLCFVLIVLNSLSTAIADKFMKDAITMKTWQFWAGMGLYVLTGYFWYLLMKTSSMTLIGVTYGVVTVLTLIGFDYFYYGNRNINFWDMVWVFIILAGVVKLTLKFG